ncbi:ABC transporter permease [Catellatospora sp. NPDC049609]|uniref:ABC transporter permease n=1 Tax=Catellatospora sp. NPDC049609 TaxID=3155505 RepID=UPI00343E3002
MRHALRVVAAEALKQHRRSFGGPLVVFSMLIWPVLQLAITYYTMLPVLDTPGIAERWPLAAQPSRLLAFLAAGAFAYLFYFSLVQSAWNFAFERISGTMELLFLSPASRLALVFANGTGALVQNTWLAGCFAVAAAGAGGALHVAHPGMYAVAALALIIPAIVWGAFLNSLMLFSRDSTFLYTLLDDPLWFVSGVRLPLFAMPLAIKAIGLAFPLTSSLAVLRGALLDAQPLTSLLEPLALLAALCTLLLAATATLLRLGETRAQRTGSMQLY